MNLDTNFSSSPSALILHRKKFMSANFALMLRTACRDFEILQRLIRREMLLVLADGQEDFGGFGCIQMALAKSFVFHVVRARRICIHSGGLLDINREDRVLFVRNTKLLLDVRDVNEHGFDAHEVKKKKSSRPSMHSHINESVSVDETSLVVFDHQKILMGPVNLYEVYECVKEMREISAVNNSHYY